MKKAQWIASNVWIQFDISLLRIKQRDDKLHSGVQLLKCENPGQASLMKMPLSVP